MSTKISLVWNELQIDAANAAQTPADIARDLLGEPIARVERFTTGLANFVYDVTGRSGEKIVIRIASPTGDTSIAAASTGRTSCVRSACRCRD